VSPRNLPLDRLIVVVAALRAGEDFARANGRFVLAFDLRQAQNILGIYLNVDINVLLVPPVDHPAPATEVSS